MPDPADPLAALGDAEAGFVLGAALLGLGADAAARLDGAPRGRCAAALVAVSRGTREERAVRLAELAGRGRPEPVAKVAADVARGVHPSWIERALADEPAALALALVEDLPGAFAEAAARASEGRGVGPADVPRARPSAAVKEALQRRLLARFPPQAPRADQEPDALAARGATLLGWSLRGAPATVVAVAMAQAGRALAERVAEGARAMDDVGLTRDEARALVGRAARGLDPDVSPADRLLVLGALAAAKESPAESRALAHRLPWRLGRLLDEESA